MLSTILAQAVEKVEQKLPPQYAKYAKVINKPKNGILPPLKTFQPHHRPQRDLRVMLGPGRDECRLES